MIVFEYVGKFDGQKKSELSYKKSVTHCEHKTNQRKEKEQEGGRIEVEERGRNEKERGWVEEDEQNKLD